MRVLSSLGVKGLQLVEEHPPLPQCVDFDALPWLYRRKSRAAARETKKEGRKVKKSQILKA